MLQLDTLGNITPLVDHYQGEPLRFVDDLDIAKNGVIYFSNATQRNPEIVENEAWEQRASGALFRYFPKTKKTELLTKRSLRQWDCSSSECRLFNHQ